MAKVKENYVPGMNMYDDSYCSRTDEEINQSIENAFAINIASEKRRYLEQKDKTA